MPQLPITAPIFRHPPRLLDTEAEFHQKRLFTARHYSSEDTKVRPAGSELCRRTKPWPCVGCGWAPTFSCRGSVPLAPLPSQPRALPKASCACRSCLLGLLAKPSSPNRSLGRRWQPALLRAALPLRHSLGAEAKCCLAQLPPCWSRFRARCPLSRLLALLAAQLHPRGSISLSCSAGTSLPPRHLI